MQGRITSTPQHFPFHIVGNMETSSVHPSPSGSDCDNNSVIPVLLDAVVDVVNNVVAARPTVCSMLHAEKIL